MSDAGTIKINIQTTLSLIVNRIFDQMVIVFDRAKTETVAEAVKLVEQNLNKPPTPISWPDAFMDLIMSTAFGPTMFGPYLKGFAGILITKLVELNIQALKSFDYKGNIQDNFSQNYTPNYTKLIEEIFKNSELVKKIKYTKIDSPKVSLGKVLKIETPPEIAQLVQEFTLQLEGLTDNFKANVNIISKNSNLEFSNTALSIGMEDFKDKIQILNAVRAQIRAIKDKVIAWIETEHSLPWLMSVLTIVSEYFNLHEEKRDSLFMNLASDFLNLYQHHVSFLGNPIFDGRYQGISQLGLLSPHIDLVDQYKKIKVNFWNLFTDDEWETMFDLIESDMPIPKNAVASSMSVALVNALFVSFLGIAEAMELIEGKSTSMTRRVDFQVIENEDTKKKYYALVQFVNIIYLQKTYSINTFIIIREINSSSIPATDITRYLINSIILDFGKSRGGFLQFPTKSKKKRISANVEQDIRVKVLNFREPSIRGIKRQGIIH